MKDILESQIYGIDRGQVSESIKGPAKSALLRRRERQDLIQDRLTQHPARTPDEQFDIFETLQAGGRVHDAWR